MRLDVTTYSASHGYAWSSVPASVSLRKLNQFYRQISATRGVFKAPASVNMGLVSDGKTAVVFTLQNVGKWDAEKRSSDYAALALFPIEDASRIDFVDLLNDDFFWKPSRKPPSTIDYLGPVSQKVPLTARHDLQTKNVYKLADPRAVGDLISQFGARSSRWTCLVEAESFLNITCNSWSTAEGTKQ